MPDPIQPAPPLADASATFDSLMPHRVHDILVVASPYDAFIIEEGGRLTELILNEYVTLNLTDAPSVTRAATAADALTHLAHKRFDLIFTMVHAGGMDGFTFARKAKELDPHTPVAMLAFDTGEMERLLTLSQRNGVDYMFTWHGDARLFLAVIKMVEDQWNVDHDTGVAQVRTILLVEDSVRFASIYLPLLYTELVKQTQSLLDEGLNLTQRLLRIRARPKVLWARDFEGAMYQYEKYRPYMLGAISDLSFPRAGGVDPRAGVELVRRIKDDDPTMPIVLQSSQSSARELAAELDVQFIHKRSRKLLRRLQEFLSSHFGFGDFVFFMPDGTVWDRARDLKELAEKIADAPDECLRHHSRRNDFSNWMRARTEFDLASRIRPRQVDEFGSIDALRHYLVHTLQIHRAQAQRGIVADFSASRFDEQSEFVRIGQGSLGGKGRGLAFANAMLLRNRIDDAFQEVDIRVPPTAVIGTDVFDAFLVENDLHDLAYGNSSDEEIVAGFTAARLPEKIEGNLRSFVEHVGDPLAVRSSSLLEDSQSQPFAGIYKTFMIPNNDPSQSVRLRQLAKAIKLVYASTFSLASKSYIESTPYRIEDEKMAVILQHLVGTAHGERFYPSLSGVARSYNFYPIGPMQPEEGIVVMALGFGQQVVGGSHALRFSPAHPRNIPQFGTVRETLRCSQRTFHALDLSQAGSDPLEESTHLRKFELEDALQDGTLHNLASSYSAENDRLYDGIGREGVPVLTFAPLLKAETYPLCRILRRLLEVGSQGMGGPVEMEFAMDLSRRPALFGFLQIRRLVAGEEQDDVAVDTASRDSSVLFSSQALGNGKTDSILDVVYVRPDAFDPAKSQAVADEVGKINVALRDEQRRYVLIGPGRWGSSDPWLGVPVRWDQISGAKVIVETALEDFRVTPSQGTHFFQNMTARRIGYFTVNPFLGTDRIDWEWLDAQPAHRETTWLRHVRLETPLRIRIDGRSGRGAILPPRPTEPEASS